MKKIVSVLTVIAMVASLVACTSLSTDKKSGKYMIIELPSNPTTGFDFYSEILDDENKVFEIFDENYVASNNGSNIIGAGGIKTFVYKANGKGEALIDLNYRRNWQGGENAFHVYYRVRSDEKGNISFISKSFKNDTLQPDESKYNDPRFVDEYKGANNNES